VIKGWIPRAVQTGEAQVVQPIDPESAIRLTIGLHSAKRAELKHAVDDILDPKSPNYRHFLTFDEWKSRFAPSDQDVQAVSDWARANGLTEVHRFAANHLIVVEGPVRAIDRALDVTINEYAIGERRFFANDRAPTVVAEIGDRIDGIYGLSSFERFRSPLESIPAPEIPTPQVPNGPFIQASELRADAPNPAPPGVAEHPRLPDGLRPQITGPLGGSTLEPPDLWSSQAYDYDALAKLSHYCNPTHASGGSPKETSIAIVGGGTADFNDLRQFFKTYNLASEITMNAMDGASCCAVEPTVDAEWSTAMSNSCGAYGDTSHVYMYLGTGVGGSLLDVWEVRFPTTRRALYPPRLATLRTITEADFHRPLARAARRSTSSPTSPTR
jgi:subtilase family serine protease